MQLPLKKHTFVKRKRCFLYLDCDDIRIGSSLVRSDDCTGLVVEIGQSSAQSKGLSESEDLSSGLGVSFEDLCSQNAFG